MKATAQVRMSEHPVQLGSAGAHISKGSESIRLKIKERSTKRMFS